MSSKNWYKLLNLFYVGAWQVHCSCSCWWLPSSGICQELHWGYISRIATEKSIKSSWSAAENETWYGKIGQRLGSWWWTTTSETVGEEDGAVVERIHVFWGCWRSESFKQDFLSLAVQQQLRKPGFYAPTVPTSQQRKPWLWLVTCHPDFAW